MNTNLNSKKLYNYSTLNTQIYNRPVPQDNVYLPTATHVLHTRHILPSQISSISLDEQVPHSYFRIQSTNDLLSSHSNDIKNIVPLENRSMYGITTMGHAYLPKSNNQDLTNTSKNNRTSQEYFGHFNTDTRKNIIELPAPIAN